MNLLIHHIKELALSAFCLVFVTLPVNAESEIPPDKELEMHMVLITMPVYQDKKTNEKVLKECFEILGMLRGENALFSLDFHNQHILAHTYRKHTHQFLLAFTKQFNYGIESGPANVMQKVWANKTSK
jgi:hypothetical protein